MSRLIDADSLFKTIEQNDYYVMSPENNVAKGMFTTGIEQAIDEQPTVDAVEVVRCKDCKHGHMCYGTGGTAVDCGFSYALKDPNGFCDDGEPKEVSE